MSTCRFRRLWLFVLVCGTCFFGLAGSLAHADSIALHKRTVRGASTVVITADLNDPTLRIEIALPERGVSYSEHFVEMVRRTRPIAAVTGTYFDTRTLLPVGTIVIGGKTVHVNCIGTTICFAADNRVWFVNTAKDERDKVAGVDYALRAGPRLLSGGNYALNARREGFRDPGIFGRRSRMALGTTVHNKLLLVSVRTPVTFGRLASIMKTLGAVEAVCLDGGTSSAVYYRGRVVVTPGRKLTNIIQVRRVPAEVQDRSLPQEERAADKGSGLRTSGAAMTASAAPEVSAESGAPHGTVFAENDAVLAAPVAWRPPKDRGTVLPGSDKPRAFTRAGFTA